MDAVEVARQIAARLHDEAVVNGADPSDPLRFALSEAERRAIGVEPAAAGAESLHGALASYLPAYDLILYEDTGTPFERAFRIAHELGHVVLGDAAELCQIDPTRPAEAAPVGTERVVDHGKRQRREVQMDLFAREFLLPRPNVCRLHIDDGLSAAAIAERFGAPYEVVAQQMFDALLLPPIAPPETKAAKAGPPLNDDQRLAAEHRGTALLLEAGPGTGKTQTLIARIEDLLDKEIDPRSILVLTFSNKAAGEMSERIAAKRPEAAAAMWVGTFHAFGLDVIHRFHDKLELPGDPQMLDRVEAVEMLEDEFPRLGLAYYRDLYDPSTVIADVLAAISRAKDEVVGHNRYAELAQAMKRAANEVNDVNAIAEADRALEVATVYKRYEELKRARNRIDFGDLVSLPVELLERDEEVAAHFRKRYAHVLVDEYQDVNRSSVRLLKALRPSGNDLWAVGDARQSIYRFRGASSHNMGLFDTQDFHGAKRKRLRINYRSHKEIVNLFSNFAGTMTLDGGGEASLSAYRGPSGASPELRTVTNKDHTSVAIADAIEERRHEGHRYRDQAVLCSGNDRLALIGRELEALGLPVLFLGSLFERPEVRDLLSLLSLLADPRAMGLTRTSCMPEFTLDLADLGAILHALHTEEGARPSWLDHPERVSGASEAARAVLGALTAALAGFDINSQPWDVLTTVLLDRTRIAARLAVSADVADRSAAMAIWQFMNFLRVQPAAAGARVPRLLKRVRRLVRLSDERDLRQLPAAAQGIDAVRLMTIHGSKGLEFPVVHLPGLNVNTLPRPVRLPKCPAPVGMIAGASGTPEKEFKAGHNEEQECLYYVALSRARDRLHLYAVTQTASGSNRPLSKFVDRSGTGLVRRQVNPDRTIPPAHDALPVALAIEGRLRFDASALATYRKCPRRFLYTYVLRTGGRREMTPFMQMHQAVRGICEGIVRTGVTPAEPDLMAHVVAACDAQGLAESGYAAEFHGFAAAMVRYFIASRQGYRSEQPQTLVLSLDDQIVEVRPDDLLIGPDGQHVVRAVRTGHQRASETDDVAAAALVLAAQQAFPGAKVEMIHLADEEATTIAINDGKLKTRHGWLTDCLEGVRAGRFPTDPSPYICPGCPAFFICSAMPKGTLTRIF